MSILIGFFILFLSLWSTGFVWDSWMKGKFSVKSAKISFLVSVFLSYLLCMAMLAGGFIAPRYAPDFIKPLIQWVLA